LHTTERWRLALLRHFKAEDGDVAENVFTGATAIEAALRRRLR
jgi:hypothetical protein